MTWHPILSIEPGGEPIRLARTTLTIPDSVGGIDRMFRGGATMTLPAISVEDASSDVEVVKGALDVGLLRRRGVRLEGTDAELALWREGDDWSRRVVLLLGKITIGSVERYPAFTRFRIGDFSEQAERPFPPWRMFRSSFGSGLNAADDGRTFTVVYGDVPEVPLVAIDQGTPQSTTVRLVIAGHPISSRRVVVKKDGREDSGATFDVAVSEGYDAASGAGYSFVAATVASLAGANRFTAHVRGHTGKSGELVAGLGDVVDHAIRTYSGISANRIDEKRLSRFRPLANRVQVASVFGGSGEGTLIGTLRSRYEDAFSIRIGWRGGKLGADHLPFDSRSPTIRNLELGRELVNRIDPVTTNGEMAYSRYEMIYSPNLVALTFAGAPTFQAREVRDRYSDERCARAASRWGDVPYPVIEAVDVATLGAANVALAWKIDLNSVPRSVVRYEARLEDVLRLPILERYDITDGDDHIQWSNEPFRLESIQPRVDGLAELTFASFREVA